MLYYEVKHEIKQWKKLNKTKNLQLTYLGWLESDKSPKQSQHK